jgi:hypothetical protein
MEKVGLASNLRRSPLDVTLGKLFEHARQTFEERLAAIGETVDDWQASIGETVHDWHASTRIHTAAARKVVRELIETSPREVLREHIVAAEQACEHALAELRAARDTLQATISEGAGVIGRSRVRRKLRAASRSARGALRAWQELGAAYLESSTPIATPS